MKLFIFGAIIYFGTLSALITCIIEKDKIENQDKHFKQKNYEGNCIVIGSNIIEIKECISTCQDVYYLECTLQGNSEKTKHVIDELLITSTTNKTFSEEMQSLYCPIDGIYKCYINKKSYVIRLQIPIYDTRNLYDLGITISSIFFSIFNGLIIISYICGL